MNTPKLLGAFAAVALLAACESATDQAATGAGAGATGSTIRPGSQEDLIAQAGSDRVFFDFDSAVIRGDQRPTLQRQATWMGGNPAVTVQVEGHTDERGTREYNLALGQRRANAARDALVAGGVAGGRVATISYGKDRPAALGSTDDAWAQNRRAVTVVR
ncbi:peptidoglycan-associated lipoprotein Pal [Paracraurococcus ruber]|uniref:Peptidoglycan-associated lipoprotein n=1 Tax=Paracraurococcus ruber TaxID=77675 RepID=A0ABS1D663_9PROT|nr:peptidoglycan-associated lipoprotein Pal [Paracraurococcus ruber]MBK1662304.1 peptidoglycan-associated lipoprotein [Paracraurococcus ruber]TDG13155.1 peptidoglycan-associated lipoprotein Pal [Paracraurococcus ruber]